MKSWTLTLHGPGGIVGQSESQEARFVIGTEEAPDVLAVSGEGIARRHAWVWIAGGCIQVEDLAGGTLVNGHPVEGRVEAEYPASVQVGEVVLVVEVKEDAADTSFDVTIPQHAPARGVSSADVTIPQRTPTRGSTVIAAPQPQSNGAAEAATLCKYTLVREIARGGMGQIYFGEDPQLKRQVAVKVSSISEGGEDPRFSKEAEVLAHLAHPNIVPIYSIGVDAQSRPFYSMKLVKGRTLQAVLNALREGDVAAAKEYPRATLLTIFRKVCDAMAFAHAKGVLHRDLKPENIMVGEYGEVLVMDWGLAKVLGAKDVPGSGEDVASGRAPAQDTGDYGITMEGEVMGTPQYMSPEQAEGMVAELDARSDIYSLGGILYAILTLRPPIDGKTLNEVLTKVKRGEITSMATKRSGKTAEVAGVPAAMGAEVPEALQAVTLKAMATDRNKRYESVAEVAADIEAYQNGFATSAENAGALRQFALFIKRNKGVSASVALFLVAAAAFVVKLAASEKVARAHEKHALSEMEKSRREAARNSLMLAELSLEADDLEGVERALKSVPQDLRDPTWRYLEKNIDACDRRFVPEGKASWIGLENHPRDPRMFVSLQSDGTFCSLNAETGEVSSRWKMELHGRSPYQMASSADGRWVAVAFKKAGKSTESEIQVFDFESGKSTGVPATWSERAFYLKVSERSVLAITAPDGSGSGRAAVCCCWDVQTGKLHWEKTQFTQPGFSKSGAEVTGFGPGGFIRVATETGEPVSPPFRPAMGFVSAFLPNAFAYAEDGNTLYGGSGDRFTMVNMASNSQVFSVRSEGGIRAIGVPGIGSFLAVVRSGKNCVKLELRKRSNGDLVRSALLKGAFKAFPDSETTIRLSTDAVALRLFMDSRSIRIWNLKPTKPVHHSVFKKGGASIMWQGEGDEGLVLSGEGSKKWVLERVDYRQGDGGKTAAPLMRLERYFNSSGYLLASISQRGDWVVYQGAKDGVNGWFVNVASVTGGEAHEVWSKDVGSGILTAIHPTRDELWAKGHLLDLKTGQELGFVNHSDYRLRSSRARLDSHSAVWVGEDFVLEPVDKWVAAKDGSGREPLKVLALWNMRTCKLEAEAVAPYSEVLAASPDGKVVLEGGSDRRLRVRDGRTLELLQELRVHDGPVAGLAWHPGRPLVATSSGDGFIRIWNRDDWSLVEEIRTEAEKSYDLTVSPSGRRLLSTDLKREVQVYEPRSFQD